MLRHSLTRSLFERRDVIVVDSISCIYGLGIPSEYLKAAVKFEVGETLNIRGQLRELVNIYPAKHFVMPKDRLDSAISTIRSELR